MAKRKSVSKKMKGNLNAEVWDLETSIKLFEDSIELAKNPIKKYDFIGEVASEMNIYREIYVYLKDKFKECKPLYKQLSSILEANCFSHTKKGEINTAIGIVNLKSNYGWTDRVEKTIEGGEKPVKVQATIISLGNGINPNEVTD